MKTVYFVRHGQTQKNLQHIHQGPYEPLTEKGKEQAKEVAQKLKGKGIDTLLSSPFVRAMETATIIGEELGLPLTKADSLKEFRRPDPMYGRSHYSLTTLWYILQLFLNREKSNWNNQGAENMFSIRNRIVDTKRLIAGQAGEKIVVVSHAIYIDMLVQSVCADRSLTLKEFFGGFMGAKKLPNCGLVVFEVDETAPPETCNWRLIDEETSPQYLKYR